MKVELLPKIDKKSGQIELNDSVWSVKYNADIVAHALYVYLSNSRKGTANAKTRGQVAGGGRKPWKQKGTGRARQGSTRSPIWVKGGVTFVPNERNWSKKLNKKMSQNAITVMLSDRVKNKMVNFVSVDEIKNYKKARELLSQLGFDGSVTVITNKKELALGIRNMKNVSVADPANVNIFDIASSKWLMVDEPSVKVLEERLQNE